MTCPLHVTSQPWCRACAPAPVDYTTVVGNPLLRETIIGSYGIATDLHRDLAAANATIAALQSQLASESRAILVARVSALAAALRVALADVDPKAMSTYEQQAQRRHARALLEEAAG